jgi:hypothetical protein
VALKHQRHARKPQLQVSALLSPTTTNPAFTGETQQ